MRHGGDALADFGVGGEILATDGLISELLFVGVDGFELGLKLVGYVHDERGAHIVIERGIDDLEGAEGLVIA